ncbi:MAG TPA: type II toxin-antitoxin system VapC family toxin [Bryobacteraceae bacterium]|nr:type II toxin-antitoxin system VapC family toxin [Bryobacteraceae bacterium]
MSGFLLDTNIPSEITKPIPAPSVLRWLGTVAEAQTFLSVVSLGEMRKGCELLEPGSKRRIQLERWLDEDVHKWLAGRILPVTEAVAQRWGKLEATRQRLGLPLNTADGQIAATALEHGLTLVTRNVKDFSDLGVSILNPWEDA